MEFHFQSVEQLPQKPVDQFQLHVINEPKIEFTDQLYKIPIIIISI